MDKILEIINQNEMVILSVGAVVVELALRLFKTKVPVGLIHSSVVVVKKVAAILQKVAEISDKLLPQNLK